MPMSTKPLSVSRLAVAAVLPLALAACNSSGGASNATAAMAAAPAAPAAPAAAAAAVTQFPVNLTSPGPLQPAGTTGDSTFAALINGVRAGVGAAPLTYNSRLDQAAQGHANDMVRQNYFSHDSLDGRNLGDRVRATGYQFALIGENIAQGQQSEQAALDGWQGSAGHKANNENPAFEHFGLGQAGTGANAKWVLVFGDPL